MKNETGSARASGVEPRTAPMVGRPPRGSTVHLQHDNNIRTSLCGDGVGAGSWELDTLCAECWAALRQGAPEDGLVDRIAKAIDHQDRHTPRPISNRQHAIAAARVLVELPPIEDGKCSGCGAVVDRLGRCRCKSAALPSTTEDPK